MIEILNELARFQAATLPERRRAQAALAEQLGSDFALTETTGDLDALPFVQVSSGIRFNAVPGGSFRMGLSDEDLADASDHIDWSSAVAKAVRTLSERARPLREVEVRPFLCSTALLSDVQLAALSSRQLRSDSFSRAEARELLTDSGFRLPSEAEWEWVARDGGRFAFVLDAAQRSLRKEELVSRFGLAGLGLPQWVEDDWHPNYEGAPSDSKPWVDSAGDKSGVQRAGFFEAGWQSREELLFALAAVRSPAEEPCWLRLAMGISA